METRKMKQKMETEYRKLQKFDDDVVIVDKQSIPEERESFRKQNSSPNVISKEKEMVLVVQQSKASLTEQSKL